MRLAVVAVIAGVGCLGDPSPYRCDLRGGDRACDSVTGAVCVDQYCAEAVSHALCASGFRYTTSAASPGACAPPRDAATDAVAVADVPRDAAAPDARIDAPPPEDHPRVDVVDAGGARDDAPIDAPADAVDARAGSDVAEGLDVFDATVRDVVAARDVVADGASIDVVDAPAARDAADVTDAPGGALPACLTGLRIVSPMPNERVFGQRVTVRTEGASSTTQLVVTGGIDCLGDPVITPLQGGFASFEVRVRGYLCLALQSALPDGRPCTTQPRHIAATAYPTLVGPSTPQGGLWPDFNNDGWADLLMATEGALLVQSFIRNGTFGSGLSPASQPGASVVALAAVGDVDGDGYGDAVASWDALTQRTVLLYRGGPAGLNSAPVTVLSRPINTDVSFAREVYGLGDLDGDGRTEFALLDLFERALTVISVDSAGGSRISNSLGVGMTIRAVAAGADLTGDGRADVAISHGGQVRVFPGGGGGALDIVPATAHGSFADVMTAGVDGDGDGVSELVVRNGTANALHVYRYAPGGFVRDVRLDGAATDAATLVAPGDLDGARPDELVVLDAAGTVRVRLGGASSDATGSFAWSTPAGALLAGTSSPEPRGRVWYARSQSHMRHGIEILGMNGATITSQLADALYPSAVRLVAR